MQLIYRSRDPSRSRALAQLIQKVEQRNAHDSVQPAQQERLLQVKPQLLGKQRARHYPIEELVENEKEERQKEPNQAVVYIEPNAYRRGEIPYQRFDDSEHPQWVFRK